MLLVSATIDVVAEAVADSLHCEQYYSTALEYKDGACTGKMVKDLLGNKCIFLNEKGILHQIKSFFYGWLDWCRSIGIFWDKEYCLLS